MDRYILAINRDLAAWLGLDPRFTISTNIARSIARHTGVPFHTAKAWFHAGVGGFIAGMFSLFGFPFIASLTTGALLTVWMEHFDNSLLLQ